ncbi:MAG: single-stranded DNA-binding protein [Cellulomonadaceae bacterium]|nr:single-stranded DNA-binding protein [Cellulomonadaceae bacterium]
MSSNGLTVTVVGWAATTPREVVGDGVPFTSFRLATTPRWFDSRQGLWVEGRTEWFTVKAFRDVAFNVAASIHKGDPVVVHGKVRTEEWAGEDGPRTTLVLDASALGHDLTRGTAKFARTVRVAPAGEVAGASDLTEEPEAFGGPGAADEVDPWETQLKTIAAGEVAQAS